MYTFKVGELFPLPGPQQDHVSFSVEPYTMMLIYRYTRPSEEEVQAFSKGAFEMAVTEMRDTLFVLSRFGGLRWADTPYSTHLSQSVKNLPDLPEDSKGYSLDAFFVDAQSNVLKAHRLVRLTPDFYQKFRAMLMKDMEKPFEVSAYQQAVEQVFSTYSTADLLKYRQLYMKEEKSNKNL